MESSVETEFDMNELVKRLRTFMENEARSCSMDFGCVTPEYVYRMWGGTVSFDEIVAGMESMKVNNYGD